MELEKIVQTNSINISELIDAVREQSQSIRDQDMSISRLESSANELAILSRAQWQSIDQMVERQSRFLVIAEKQVEIIGNLTAQRV